MAQQGIYWFNDGGPEFLAQKLSVASEKITSVVQGITEELMLEAADQLTDIQLSSKQENGVITGGPATISRRMLRSIDYKVAVNGRGRVQGEFGFINNAPDHVGYKEKGTDTGMIPMLGLNRVNLWLEGAAEEEFGQSFWKEVGLL